MQRSRMVISIVAVILVSEASAVLSLEEAIDVLGARIVSEQITTEGPQIGTWPQEEWASGSIILGLVSAYERQAIVNTRKLLSWRASTLSATN